MDTILPICELAGCGRLVDAPDHAFCSEEHETAHFAALNKKQRGTGRYEPFPPAPLTELAARLERAAADLQAVADADPTWKRYRYADKWLAQSMRALDLYAVTGREEAGREAESAIRCAIDAVGQVRVQVEFNRNWGPMPAELE